MITPREGWSSFQGGGTNEQCGEQPQDDNPGNDEIPPITIETLDSEGNAIAAVLFCEPRAFKVAYRVMYLKALGGIPPFGWTTSEGIIEITGPRTAKVSIMAGLDYFKPVWYGHSEVRTSPLVQVCYPENNGDETHRVSSEAAGQVYLIGYDCSGEPIGPNPSRAGQPGDPPDFTNANYYLPNTPTLRENLPSGSTFVNVIGNTTDRIATTSFGGSCIGNVDSGVDALWLLQNEACCADANGFNPLALLIECKTAGKACYNEGTVHVAAPDYSEIFNIPISDTNPPGAPLFEVVWGVDTATNFIDVRTERQLPGYEVLVTATDYVGVTVAITVET